MRTCARVHVLLRLCHLFLSFRVRTARPVSTAPVVLGLLGGPE